ncbi:oxidative damage protection protein [Candidatus Steffania adelgidicola]|uniref:oxidative damage protection protein n=1 Tax=Candidatus Steffania adelgidicola TaxID=1076626 RepID=UPI001D017F4C|nr:oxidative damage protection protein [Candidatus Steffania adelgidicola]UDG79594.1 putative Fe(2+)-trafficking protein [Candidatus Steffania adelgidicola]
MARIIYCVFLKREEKGQDFEFYPGELGKRIYENISQAAWTQWKIKQTMLINEKKLCLIKAKDRKTLEKEMINFLFKDQDVHLEGHTPSSA